MIIFLFIQYHSMSVAFVSSNNQRISQWSGLGLHSLYKIYYWNFKNATENETVSCFIAYNWLCNETGESFQGSSNLCEVMRSSETATPKSGWDLIKPHAICTLQVYTFIFNKLIIIALILTRPCKIRIFIYQIAQSVICLS